MEVIVSESKYKALRYQPVFVRLVFLSMITPRLHSFRLQGDYIRP